jgi:hypothetical protein
MLHLREQLPVPEDIALCLPSTSLHRAASVKQETPCQAALTPWGRPILRRT